MMRRFVVLLLVAGLVLGVTACAAEEEPTTAVSTAAATEPAPTNTPGATEPAPTSTPAEEVLQPNLDEITEDPDTYYGRQVRVFADIDERLGPNAVTVVSSTLLDLNEVLVLNVPSEAIDTAQEEEAPLDLTGTVRRFVRADIKAEYDLDLDEEVYDEFEGDPVIIAQSAEALTTEAIFGVGEATLRAIVDNPETYYGQEVTLSGAVAEVIGERTVGLSSTVYPYVDPVLMITTLPDVLDAPLETGALVELRGEVREFTASELEAELDVSLTGEAYSDYEGRPVLLVDAALIVTEEQTARIRRLRVIRPADISDERLLRVLLTVPAQFYGRWTKVVGSVSELIDEHAFTLEGTSVDIGGELLVIHIFEEPVVPLAEATPVVVAGAPRPFDRDELEELLDIDLSAEAYTAFEGKPVMIAETLRIISQTQLRRIRRSALQLLSEIPEEYVGQEMTVAGPVSDVVGDRSFALAGGEVVGDDDVLVIRNYEEAGAVLAEGEQARVRGTVRLFDETEIEDEFNLDLDDGLYDEYASRPVIVAEAIEPLAN